VWVLHDARAHPSSYRSACSTGRIMGVDGKKLTIHLDVVGSKKIMANYVEPA
jgi:hypothetical protein